MLIGNFVFGFPTSFLFFLKKKFELTPPPTILVRTALTFIYKKQNFGLWFLHHPLFLEHFPAIQISICS